MKKLLATVLFAAVVFVIGWLGYKIYRVKVRKDTLASTIVTLPSFSFYKLDNTPFTADSVANDKDRLIIMLFSPDCEHCQYTAKNYLQHKQELGSSKILMVTLADSLSATKFYTDYQLNTLPNIVMLRDPQMTFPKTFGAGMIPTFLVYKNGKLINRFIGETRVENLLSDSTMTAK